MKNSFIGKLQVAICAVAVLAMAYFSFMPLIGVSVESGLKVYESSFDTVLEAAMEKELDEIEESTSMSEEAKQKAAEKAAERYITIARDIAGVDSEGNATNKSKLIAFSFIDVIKAFSDTGKLARYYIMAMSADAMDAETEEHAEYMKQLVDAIEPEAVNAESVDLFRLLFNDVASCLNFEAIMNDESADGNIVFEFIAQALFAIIKAGVLIAVVVIFPIAMLLSCLGFLFVLLSKEKYVKVLKKSKKAVVRISCLAVALAVLDAELLPCATAALITAGVVILINLVASRLKSYNKKEKRFLNVMQLSSLISGAGAAVMAVFIARSDIIRSYVGSDLLTQATATMTDENEVMAAIAVFAGMSIIALAVFTSAVNSALKLITRCACMGKSGGKGIFSALLGIGLIALNYFVTDRFDIALTSEQSESLTVALIGCAVIIVGAIIFTVLKGIFVGKIGRAEVRAVMCGTSVGTDVDGEE